MVDQNVFTLKIGGQAGQGIKSAGLMFSKIATRSGYYTYNYTEYPSLIRSGHNVMQICISSEEVTGPFKKTDFLIALNQETIDLHQDELISGSGIIFDEGKKMDISKLPEGTNLYPVPLSKLVMEMGGQELLINSVALGAAVAVLGGEFSILKNLLGEEFDDKGKEIVGANQNASELGFNVAREKFSNNLKKVLNILDPVVPRMVMGGNDAVALGAIAGGLQFAAIYPMSPISGILQTLALYQEKYGYIYKQPEDEIAAINMAIGASFAGARSMTATSGGGFCLMTEGLGLAAMTETPVVIINGMRPGPATGLATWSGQGDLLFVLSAHQGDFPRIVLAAGDAKEAFFLTMEAFNLADRYQTPVILLIDKNICENEQSFSSFDMNAYEIDRGKLLTEKSPDYERFALSPDGISPRAIPGSGNYFIANSYEHDLQGFSTEKISDINLQMEKRMSKLKTCAAKDMPIPQLFGPEDADITIVSWGSNKGSILQAMKNLNNVNFLHITWMNPFPVEVVTNILKRAKHIVDIECNFSGQLADLIMEKTGIGITDKLLKYDGRPFFIEEIVKKIKNIND